MRKKLNAKTSTAQYRKEVLILRHLDKMNTKFLAVLVLALAVATLYLPSCESFASGNAWKRTELQVIE